MNRREFITTTAAAGIAAVVPLPTIQAAAPVGRVYNVRFVPFPKVDMNGFMDLSDVWFITGPSEVWVQE